MGGQALGAVTSRAVASTLGLRTAFAIPALDLLVGGWWAARRMPLKDHLKDPDVDVSQALHWPQPPDRRRCGDCSETKRTRRVPRDVHRRHLARAIRQHLERGTVMDREIEAKARRLTMEERPPITHHLIWAGAAPYGCVSVTWPRCDGATLG
jgi:hypothetical protein